MTIDHIRRTIGRNIRAERDFRRLSIEEFAELMGLTSGFIGLIERGQRGTTPLTLFKAAKIFNIPIDDFFDCQRALGLCKDEAPILARRRKLDSLISDFSEWELDFVISTVINIRVMSRRQVEIDDSEVAADDE